MEMRGALALLLLLLLRGAGAEPAAGTTCPGGRSWSPDLDKCMDCAICLHHPKSDFCTLCGDPQPPEARLWLVVGGTMAGVAVLGLVGGALLWARCRKREQFTTPIEETGGHSGEESLIH
ncbi:tumor necrosis factor receptor superfamily member 12A [Carettochelys insculpta]|uniref:tumor necrosis factor receptor superfamily member 12A n=1 Tax=Carettochelys insculpta TaxID=44489 RepID=UPI003EBA17BC